MSRIGTEEAFKLGPLLREVEADGRRVIRCNLGQPDFPLPGHITEAVVAALRAGHTTYCDPQGLPELREAIASSVGVARDLEIDPARFTPKDQMRQWVREFPPDAKPQDFIPQPADGGPPLLRKLEMLKVEMLKVEMLKEQQP